MENDALYVLVRTDLPANPMHKIVQSGHAVAGYVSKYSETFAHGRMVYLGVINEAELKIIKHDLDRNGIDSYIFHEPYWNEYTALAVVTEKKSFSDLKLLKL